MTDQIFTQHRFTIVKDGLSYSDALVLPQAEYEALTPQEIETRKTERFTNWKAIIDNPPVQVEPTKEEQLAQLDAEKLELERKYPQIQGKEISLSEVDVASEKQAQEAAVVEGGK